MRPRPFQIRLPAGTRHRELAITLGAFLLHGGDVGADSLAAFSFQRCGKRVEKRFLPVNSRLLVIAVLQVADRYGAA